MNVKPNASPQAERPASSETEGGGPTNPLQTLGVPRPVSSEPERGGESASPAAHTSGAPTGTPPPSDLSQPFEDETYGTYDELIAERYS